MTTTISLRLGEQIVHKLEDIADTTERTKSFLIRKAIEQYIEEFADYQIAWDRLNDVHDETISSKEMRKLLANNH